MSMEAKTMLLDEIREKLSTKITAAAMEEALNAIREVIEKYSVESNFRSEFESNDYLKAYLAALKIQSRSAKTLVRYAYIITRAMKTIGVPMHNLNIYHFRTYFANEQDRGIAPSTLEGSRQILNTYFEWLQREGLIITNPLANFGAIKVPEVEKEIYSDIDIEKLKLNAKTLRDRAIIYFLSTTGCRISEMTSLNRDDIDLNSLECIVWGKGAKERTVYLSPVTGMVIKEYLISRTDDNEALFVGRGAERFQLHGVRQMLKDLAKISGVKDVYPHKFRRTFASNLIKHGMPIQQVAAILGHDKLDTTMEYVVLDKTDVKNSYRKYA